MNQDPAREAIEAAARARAAIECAIVTLSAYRASMNEGQVNAVKRILYDVETD